MLCQAHCLLGTFNTDIVLAEVNKIAAAASAHPLPSTHGLLAKSNTDCLNSPTRTSRCLRSTTLLHRPVVKDTAQQLETALAVADGASEYLVKVTRTAADNAAAEILAGETLQEIMAGRLEMAPGSAVDTLSQAVQAAQQFPNLKVRPGIICLISSNQQNQEGLQCVLCQLASNFQGKDRHSTPADTAFAFTSVYCIRQHKPCLMAQFAGCAILE